MTSYQNSIMDLLEGDTPKAKFDFLNSMIADFYSSTQKLKLCKNNLQTLMKTNDETPIKEFKGIIKLNLDAL